MGRRGKRSHNCFLLLIYESWEAGSISSAMGALYMCLNVSVGLLSCHPGGTCCPHKCGKSNLSKIKFVQKMRVCCFVDPSICDMYLCIYAHILFYRMRRAMTRTQKGMTALKNSRHTWITLWRTWLWIWGGYLVCVKCLTAIVIESAPPLVGFTAKWYLEAFLKCLFWAASNTCITWMRNGPQVVSTLENIRNLFMDYPEPWPIVSQCNSNLS